MTESLRIEFKRQLTDTLEKKVVAFLNTKQGGEIYIGVDDVTQQPIALADLDDFFSDISHPQNKVLMRVFRDLDMVEHLGSGVPRILQFYPKSSYVFLNNFTRVVFPYAEGFTTTDQATDQDGKINFFDQKISL
ncbi:MAG: helix-turn-helix domain-containing protein [Thiomicrospira sp.]